MAKTNYNRVEDAINKGLHQLKVAALLKEADAAQSKSDKPAELRKLTPKQMMSIVKQDLKSMHKQDPAVYTTLNLTKKKVEDLIKLTNTEGVILNDEQIQEITQLKENVGKLKKEKFPDKTDEETLAAEINRHVYKRHNTQEKWIPLDTHSDWDKYKKKPRR